jgi:hypothetical protein
MDKVNDIQIQLDQHEEITPSCFKKFEDLKLDIQQLQTEEKLKSEYQTAIVEKILQPILKELTDGMKLYTDQKIQILTNDFDGSERNLKVDIGYELDYEA